MVLEVFKLFLIHCKQHYNTLAAENYIKLPTTRLENQLTAKTDNNLIHLVMLIIVYLNKWKI
jgi:hypothetical protein